MWIHGILFLVFCVLFCSAKGLFLKSGNYLAGKLPAFFDVNGKQIRVCLMVVFFGNLLGMAFTVSFLLKQENDLYLLERKSESYTEEWYVSDGTYKEKIEVEVRPQPHTEDEKQELLEQAAASLEQKILGKNAGLDKVEYPLNLVTELPEEGILVSWDTDQPLILDWDGQIGEDVPESGIAVELEAELILEDCSRMFETTVKVFPAKKTDSEQLVAVIQDELERQNNQSGEYLKLPKLIDDKNLIWTSIDLYYGVMLTGVSVLIGVLLIFSEKSRRKEQEKKRWEEMERDYPGILSKMILLMQSGVSSRKAIRKIALDYKWDKAQGRPKRAAYEEILKVHQDLEQGVPEDRAYRELGNRCDLLCYRTFSTLLVQNLKKGGCHFLSALKKECAEAFEKRKKAAIIRGEKAGTKLLIPMGCMLLIVLVIILVPSMMALG